MTTGTLKAWWLLLLTLAAESGVAQFNEYKPPGTLGQRPENRQQALEEALDEARWRFGAVRLEPWIGLRDLSYVDNATVSAEGEQESDLTATVGAGLRAYLPLSDDLTLALHALPEYVWWRDLDDRRQLNGRYGVGLFGFFTRSSLELTLSRLESQRFVTSEAEQLVNSRRDLAALDLETRIVGATGFYLTVSNGEEQNLQGEDDEPGLPPVDRLDRDEQLIGGGLRWRPREDLTIDVGVERSTIDFADPANDRSNEGTSPMIAVRLEGEGLSLEASIALRDLDRRGDSAFVPFREPTGNVSLNLRPGGRLDYAFYADRTLAFSFNRDYSYFESNRFGAAVEAPLGWRTEVRGFVETGENDYTGVDALSPRRSDDFFGYGVSARMQLFGNTNLTLSASRSDYDSNLEFFDREVTVIRTGLVLGRDGSWW